MTYSQRTRFSSKRFIYDKCIEPCNRSRFKRKEKIRSQIEVFIFQEHHKRNEQLISNLIPKKSLIRFVNISSEEVQRTILFALRRKILDKRSKCQQNPISKPPKNTPPLNLAHPRRITNHDRSGIGTPNDKCSYFPCFSQEIHRHYLINIPKL